MKLLKVQRSRSPDKIYLIFKSGRAIPFFIDDFVSQNLSIGSDYSEDFIYPKSLSFLLRSYALRQVAISPKIEKILRPKLSNQVRLYGRKFYGDFVFSNVVVDQIISDLNEKKLLDESQYASFIVRRYQKKSHRFLEQLFFKYGLNLSLLPLPVLEKEKIKKILEKKNINLSNPMDFKTKTKLIYSLSQKGFAYNDIKTVIDELINLR